MLQSSDYIPLLTTGFNVCFAVYCLFSFSQKKRGRYYLYLALVSLCFSAHLVLIQPYIKQQLNPAFFSLTNSLVQKGVVLFFYLFELSFLNPPPRSYLRYALYTGIVYMCGGVLARLVASGPLSFLHEWYRGGFMYLDIAILLLLIFYLWRKTNYYERLVLYGLLFISLLALATYCGENFYPLADIGLTETMIRQIEISGGFCFFFLAILNREQEVEKEKLKLQTKLLQKEVQLQKDIIAERERISRDMHDGIGAGISALKLQAELLKSKIGKNGPIHNDIDELLHTSEDMSISMRQMMSELTSGRESIDSFANQALIQAKTFLHKTPIQLQYQLDLENKDTVISRHALRELVFCIKEAINNIYKHSHASHVFIAVIQKEKLLWIEIKDDGIGLDAMRQTGSGLHNMRQRMINLGGSFELLPASAGTHLRYTLPV
ncbi:two-component system, NarL family, sensor histidine kinase DesK [Niabella drilacis]|uniref:histidine kinase n=2 Tax=Niabella drilacis (strain DSM 25811 / CCM 8410 / CCUG 62505 / LMG 26954 / E90) TaxID=1285928 RepID=A0A1G6J3F8_NIADE|nr:two-component system, NarL family, sensor histidine kinase DesK [Niabella drilacis]